jgi:dTDP-4-amino-4,6-dideoxygalactose transaminase
VSARRQARTGLNERFHGGILITPRTKVLVVVHYAGIACDMDVAMALAKKYNLLVVEDAAQAIDSSYWNQPLGGIGNLGCFSFHETKNIISGEGGALIINDDRFLRRAEIIWEKGTNRAEFFRGEVNKYGWVDTGSSFLPSEITAAFLYAQLEQLNTIQARRLQLWNVYANELTELVRQGTLEFLSFPSSATNNAHMFPILCRSMAERARLIEHLKIQGILAVFHYLPLHSSPFYQSKHDGRLLPYANRFADCLLRMPLFYELKPEQIVWICKHVRQFYS